MRAISTTENPTIVQDSAAALMTPDYVTAFPSRMAQRRHIWKLAASSRKTVDNAIVVNTVFE